MKKTILKKRVQQFGAAFLAVSTIIAAEAVTISDVEVGNVTTTEFYLCWETDQSSVPGLDVFGDAGETQSLEGVVEIEFFPLNSDRRSVASSVAIRDAGRSLRDAIKAKNLVLVKVSGLAPGTDYYARPKAVDALGSTIASGALQSVTTAQTVTFVNESLQVVIDLSAIDTPTTPAEGAIVMISTPAARYPLLTVAGDAIAPDRAYADATHFLNAAGDTNLLPSGLTPLAISWKGLPPFGGTFTGANLDYAGGPVVAQSSEIPFVPFSGDLNYVVTFEKTPPVLGLPQNIMIEAVDTGGGTVTDYAQPAEVTATGTLIQGGGITAPFVNGLLARHTINFGSAGAMDVTISDPFGSSETTIPVTVLPLTYENWRIYYFGDNTSPEGAPDQDPDGDSLTNDGEFSTLNHPLRRNGEVLKATRTAGGLKVWIDFNRFQTEYVVGFETSNDLVAWFFSAAPITVQQSLPEKDILEVILPDAEFNDLGSGYTRARFGAAPP